ncbi:amidohydrolase family protein [Cryptosporangium sp. NPDC051539]|uniref:amidohydrolase family protein n=1 Tax=Cryptosporangium sp. NPDC051539 TaxID=3363962 RepID=UPI0037A9ED9E
MIPIIDADAHVMETPDIFTSRFPAKDAQNVPHVKVDPSTGREMWYVGDTAVHGAVFSVIKGGKDDPVENRENAPTGNDGDEWAHLPRTLAEVHPSSYDPNERVKVMDQFGIQAATTFPNLTILGPDIFRESPSADLDFGLKVVSAYNDWIMTWPQQQPGRFIPLACIPYWDVEGAVKEIERCAEMGMKGLVMSGRPDIHGCPILPDPQYDRMWAAAQATGLSVSFHAGAGGFENFHNENRQRITGTPSMQIYSTVSMLFQNTISAVDLLTSGILARYPNLNFGIIETGAGWAPFALEAIDVHYKRYKPWEQHPEMSPDVLPSDLFRRQVYINVWFEQLAEVAGDLLDNVMFETDYPHPTCLVGDDIREVLEVKLAGLTPEQTENVLYKNAMRYYGLKLADIGLAE